MIKTAFAKFYVYRHPTRFVKMGHICNIFYNILWSAISHQIQCNKQELIKVCHTGKINYFLIALSSKMHFSISFFKKKKKQM